MKQVFVDFSRGNLITYILHNAEKVFCNSHISIQKQKLRTKGDCQALISVCKTMKLTCAKKEMRYLVDKIGIIVIILDMLENAV